MIDVREADTAPSEFEAKAAAKVHRVAGTTDARIAEKDAESARRLRERQAEVELRRQELEAKRVERDAKAAARDAKRTRRAARRQAKRQARVRRLTATITRVHVFVAGNMPAVYSSCIYAMSLYVAVSGQISMATDRGWPLVVGIGMAVFLEGLALSMALTAHQLRLRNERALVPVAMTWIAAGFASAINVVAHRDDPIMAAVLGASSLAAIIVWEVRSGAKHRAVLRAKGWLPEPPERFGLRRWLRYPRETWEAWSLDVKNRVSDGAALLLEQVRADRDQAAAATSAGAAQVAQIGAALAFGAAAREAAQARAAAAEAVKAAKRTARPKRPFRSLFKRAAKETVAERTPPAKVTAPRPAITAAPAAAATKPKPAEPRPEPKPRAAVDERKARLLASWNELNDELDRWPTVTELSTRSGIAHSTAGDWRKKHVASLTLEGAIA